MYVSRRSYDHGRELTRERRELAANVVCIWIHVIMSLRSSCNTVLHLVPIPVCLCILVKRDLRAMFGCVLPTFALRNPCPHVFPIQGSILPVIVRPSRPIHTPLVEIWSSLVCGPQILSLRDEFMRIFPANVAVHIASFVHLKVNVYFMHRIPGGRFFDTNLQTGFIDNFKYLVIPTSSLPMAASILNLLFMNHPWAISRPIMDELIEDCLDIIRVEFQLVGSWRHIRDDFGCNVFVVTHHR